LPGTLTGKVAAFIGHQAWMGWRQAGQLAWLEQQSHKQDGSSQGG